MHDSSPHQKSIAPAAEFHLGVPWGPLFHLKSVLVLRCLLCRRFLSPRSAKVALKTAEVPKMESTSSLLRGPGDRLGCKFAIVGPLREPYYLLHFTHISTHRGPPFSRLKPLWRRGRVPEHPFSLFLAMAASLSLPQPAGSSWNEFNLPSYCAKLPTRYYTHTRGRTPLPHPPTHRGSARPWALFRKLFGCMFAYWELHYVTDTEAAAPSLG